MDFYDAISCGGDGWVEHARYGGNNVSFVACIAATAVGVRVCFTGYKI
eukprot:SAG31_NODE_1707_length_7484_cov_8.798104_7_plen_48_part_00